VRDAVRERVRLQPIQDPVDADGVDLLALLDEPPPLPEAEWGAWANPDGHPSCDLPLYASGRGLGGGV
jgi:hypothetical protein